MGDKVPLSGSEVVWSVVGSKKKPAHEIADERNNMNVERAELDVPVSDHHAMFSFGHVINGESAISCFSIMQLVVVVELDNTV